MQRAVVPASWGALLVFAVACGLPAAAAAGQTATSVVPEVIGEVRVHGNHTTRDADVLGLAGLTVGAPLAADTLLQAEARLRATGRFASVEIRKRFRSLADPSDILVVVLVDEIVGISEADPTPGPWKRFRSLGMWLPVLDYADGYGFTYGARVSFVEIIGDRSRISLPLTWGGERRAAVEVERAFDGGPLTRVVGVVALTRRENPHFEIGDTRQSARVRVERSFTSWLRAGGGFGVTAVSFGVVDRTHTTTGVDLVVDTRTDPVFPRNAIHAVLGVDRLHFDDIGPVIQRSTELRGYVGLFGSSVLALRATSSHADAPLPPYEQRLLGGAALVRGYRFGHRVGDNLAAFSAEVRVPLTSPLNVGRVGLKGFVDYGTVYNHGGELADQRFDRGIGAGMFLTATVVRIGLDVAWPKGEQARPRWHFGLGVTF